MGSTRTTTVIDTIGVASCLGGSQNSCDNAPYVIRSSPFQHILTDQNLSLNWKKMLTPVNLLANSLPCLTRISKEIASLTYQHTLDHCSETPVSHPFLLISGDHSSAIGTWSGVIRALAQSNKTLGIIWLDAHLDAHTLETSPTGNLHGMPLSVLLGRADKKLQATCPNFSRSQEAECPHLSGKNLSLLGVRNYEPEELSLLKQSHASIYGMDILHNNPTAEQMLNTIAKDLLTRCDVIGISLDLDAITPEDAPAVETPEPNGISAEMMIALLKNFAYLDKLAGFEISEFNPEKDIKHKTEKLIMTIIGALFK